MNVSVVVPAYNREKTIRRCLESILNQTYPVFEIIVVDDGSTDGTLHIAAEYDRVKTIKIEHKGAQAARNVGIKAAQGDYIAFLDSDDEWLPNKLEMQIQILQSNEKAVICCDGFVQTDQENKTAKGNNPSWREKSDKETRKLYRMRGKSGNVYKAILKESFCMFQAMVTSKENLFEIGLLDEDVPSYQEWDTAIRLAKSFKFVYIHKPLFVYHLHEGETISKNVKKDIDGLAYICEKYKYEILSQLGKKALEQRYKNVMKKCMEYGDKRLFKYGLKYIMAKTNLFLFNE